MVMEQPRQPLSETANHYGPCLLRAVLACLMAACLTGCPAVTNPVADALPVRRLPPEVRGKPKDPLVPIPLTWLEQKPPETYRLAPGDVLAVWIETVLGERVTGPPIQGGPAISLGGGRAPAVAAGYPVPVQEDGTILLPLAEPLLVAGMSPAQAREAIRQLYTDKLQILKRGSERILVSLLRPRQYQVLVLRQEAASFGTGYLGLGQTTSAKRGNGFTIDLPAYENDVLHALAATGGLPGLDAYDEVVIQRGCFPRKELAGGTQNVLAGPGPSGTYLPPQGPGTIVRIPLRWKPGVPPPFTPEDVILNSGDVVFIEARDRDVFYTGGLLPAAEHILPRDHDLDVVEAVSLARGPLVNGAYGANNLSGTLIQPGIGFDNPALLVVLRRMPCGGQLPIRVDLKVALRDRRERVLVQPGDMLILQEDVSDALARYAGQTLANFSLTWQPIANKYINGVFDFWAPNQIPNRIGIFQSFTSVH
jgi:hypothetical protein